MNRVTGTRTWATTSPDGPTAVSAFEEGLPVRLIATQRNALKTCAVDEEVAAVVKSNRENFDYLPVVKRQRIVGLLKVVQLTDRRGLVGDRMQRLSESDLIGADASILTFVRGADEHGCRLVVSGSEISGLVSLSDLQQLPVRAALFGMVTHLEIGLTRAIEREFDHSDEWIQRLPKGRQERISEEVKKAKSEDVFVNALLFTQFCDKVTIINKSPDLPCTKARFEDDLKQVQSLRDKVAHANDYAATHAAANQVCKTVRLMYQWIDQLAGWPRPSGQSGANGA